MHEKMQLIFLLKYGRSVQLNILCYIILKVRSQFKFEVQNQLLETIFSFVNRNRVEDFCHPFGELVCPVLRTLFKNMPKIKLG